MPSGKARTGSVQPEHRAGFCALAGRPNVGKTTLLNRLVGVELGAVSPRAQTTRVRLRGISTRPEAQVVFVDAPGLLEARNPLQRGMRSEAEEALAGADVRVLVVDAGRPHTLEAVERVAAPGDESVVLCLNKVDRLPQERLESVLDELGRRWRAVVPTVATEGGGVEELRRAVIHRLPLSPPLYPEDQIATAPLRFFAGEFVREACFRQLEEEVPYSIAVEVEEFREDEEPVYISAVIHVERPSQKGIVIGRGGRRIRSIGTEARERIEAFLGRGVYLDLWVKVLPKWKKRPGELERLGYRSPRKGGDR